MIRVFLLLLVALNTVSFGQTGENNYYLSLTMKLGEFNVIGDKDFDARIEIFSKELKKRPSAQGFVINYGKEDEVSAREMRFSRVLSNLLFDTNRIIFIRGGEAKIPKTEMWAVPPGARSPVPDYDNNENLKTDGNQKDTNQNIIPKAELVENFGEVDVEEFNRIFEQFFKRIENGVSLKGYIVIRGSNDEITAFENRIRGLEYLQNNDSGKIVFVRQVEDAVKATIALWIVPDGTEIPK